MKAIEIWDNFLADKQQLSEKDELIFVRKGHDEWLLKYLQKFSLGEKAELLLITYRSHQVVLDYIYYCFLYLKCHICKMSLVVLYIETVKHSNRTSIYSYCSYNISFSQCIACV